MKTWEMFKMLEDNPNLVFEDENRHRIRLEKDSFTVLMSLPFANKETDDVNLNMDDEWHIVQEEIFMIEALDILKNLGKVKFEVNTGESMLFATVKYTDNYRVIMFLEGNIKDFPETAKYMLFAEALINGTWYKVD